MERADRGFRIGLTKSVRSNSLGRARHGARCASARSTATSCGSCGCAPPVGEAGFWEACSLPSTASRRPASTASGATCRWTTSGCSACTRRSTPAHGRRRSSRSSTSTPTSRTSGRRTGSGARRSTSRCSRTPGGADRLPPGAVVVEPGRDRRAPRRCRLPRPSAARGTASGWRRRGRTTARRWRSPGRVADAGGLDIQRRARSATASGRLPPPLPPPPRHDRAACEGDEGLVPRPSSGSTCGATTARSTTSRSTPTHTYVADGVLVHNSIYRFRGGRHAEHPRVRAAFPDATVVVLEQNYRSTQTILDAANAVIANNLGPPAQGAVDLRGRGRAGRALRGRGRARRGQLDLSESPGSTTTSTTGGATSPSSTGPTPEPGGGGGARPGRASPTRSSAAPASTTGGR